LYLPEAWCQDRQRRQAARIPDAIIFQTKPEIALALLDQARAAGIPFALVGADAGYGDNPNFLDGIDRRSLGCVVDVACDFGVRRLDEVVQAADRPLPPKRKQGRPRTHPHPVQVAPLHRADAVIASLPEEAWQTITWRQGSEGPLTKQFVALRVRRSQDDRTGPEGWLIGERPLPNHVGDRKFYWSNLPADTPLARLAELAHRRPSIARFHQDGKGQTGLGDYAARLWHSFHRQLTIEMLAISWLALQRPKPKETPIVVEPLPVTTPEEPVFPLRSGTVQQCQHSTPPSLPVPVRGTGTLASADRADQLITTRRQTPLARRRSLCQHGYLTVNAMQ
jgi:SRSO17 transposase